MDKITLEERWEKAKKDTLGFRAWKRELVGAVLAAAIAYVALDYFFGSEQGAKEEVIAIGAAVLATLILIPVAEFAWNFMKAPVRIMWHTVNQVEEKLQRLQIENRAFLDSLATRFEVTPGDVEANFEEGATPLQDLFEDHQVRTGKKKYERRHKLAVHNLSKGKSIRNVHVDLIEIEAIQVDLENVPPYLNAQNPLQLLKTQLPLRLCFSDHRNPPYAESIELNPDDKANVDVVRWEFDGQSLPTFFLCHIQQGIRAEIPLGKYKLTVQVAGEDTPTATKTLILEKPEGETIKHSRLREVDLSSS